MPTAKVSKKGWVVIPREIRERNGIQPGDQVHIIDYAGRIAIIPAMEDPVRTSRGLFKNDPSLSKDLLAERQRERVREEMASGEHRMEEMKSAPTYAPLNSKEREVLRLIAEGYLNRRIAQQLAIETEAVDSVRKQIMSKLHARNRTDLIRHALRMGLVSLDLPPNLRQEGPPQPKRDRKDRPHTA